MASENKVIWSVSLVFFHKNLGFLIGEEFRYKDNEVLLHPVGGRTEDFDNDYLATGIREFIEETTLYNSSFFTEIYLNNLENWFKENPMASYSSYPAHSTFIHKDLENHIKDIHFNLDYSLHSNKIHRFIIVPVNKIKDNNFRNFITQFPFEYSFYDNIIKENTSMWNLHWFRLEQLKFLPHSSKLLLFFERLYYNHFNENKKEKSKTNNLINTIMNVKIE